MIGRPQLAAMPTDYGAYIVPDDGHILAVHGLEAPSDDETLATLLMRFNTWTGVGSVNPLWLRAAGAMGADEKRLFWKVIIPGASPLIIAGMRRAFLRSWIAVVGAEMIAASDSGLGAVIFDSKVVLRTDLMMASLVVVGVIGLAFKRLVFVWIERATAYRWGMVGMTKG